MTTREQTMLRALGRLALCGLLLIGAPAWSADEKGNLSGDVEVAYRNVSVSGEERKYDADFDGLESGFYLSTARLDWVTGSSEILDYIRFDAEGLGTNPHERATLRIGRKDAYELSFTHRKNDYIYDLFELVPDEDGATWNAERRSDEVGLRVFPSDSVKLVFQFRDAERSGTSLFMKDIFRDVFRLETPLDMRAKWYTVGGDFAAGPVDIVFRQTLRRYDNQFNNTTESDLGLDTTNSTQLLHYDWEQNDSGSTDWTQLDIHTPLGSRVTLHVGAAGTFAGEEELTSRIRLAQEGTDFNGFAFDTEGFSHAELEADTIMLDGDLSVRLVDQLDLLLQFRSMERDVSGTRERDLDGDGFGDGFPGNSVFNDYEITTQSAVLDYRPMPGLRLRGGLRRIERTLDRGGYKSLRDTDYDSGDDETLIFGAVVKPTTWLTLNADYEDGDIDQPFNAVAPQEREHLRVRARFEPQDDMQIDLSYMDFDNTNSAPDIRDPGSDWRSAAEGSTWSASLWHDASERISYLLRYAEQEFETDVGINFDTAGFGGVEAGSSIFDNDNSQILGQVNWRSSGPWSGMVRYWTAESDGDNLVLGDVNGLVNDLPIDQEFTNVELGVTYSFDSGIYVGADFHDFDYDDANDLLDYDGQIFQVRVGTRF